LDATSLHADPLDLVQADLVVSPVIQLRGARRRVIGHRCGVLECAAAVLQIRGDARCTECVVADLLSDAGLDRPALHNRMRVSLWQRRVTELAGAAPDRAEQRPFRIGTDAGSSRYACRYASSVWWHGIS